MFETKVEWEACVGENRLQFSIFSSLAAVAVIKKFCCSGWDSNTYAHKRTHTNTKGSEMSFFAGGIKTLHTFSAIIIAHRLIRLILGKQ